MEQNRRIPASADDWRGTLVEETLKSWFMYGLNLKVQTREDDFDDAIDSAITALPNRQRDAILKYYCDGLTKKQIADTWNTTTGAVTHFLEEGERLLVYPIYALFRPKQKRPEPISFKDVNAKTLKTVLKTKDPEKILEACKFVSVAYLAVQPYPRIAPSSFYRVRMFGANTLSDVIHLIESGEIEIVDEDCKNDPEKLCLKLRERRTEVCDIIRALEEFLPFRIAVGMPPKYQPKNNEKITFTPEDWRKAAVADGSPFAINEYQQDINELVDAALATFPERNRDIIQKYYRDGYTLKQIADIYGVSPAAIRQARVKAIIRLRKVLQITKRNFGSFAPGEQPCPVAKLAAAEDRRWRDWLYPTNDSPVGKIIKNAVSSGVPEQILTECRSVPFPNSYISVQAADYLRRANAYSIGDVIRLITSGDIEKIWHCDEAGVNEIICALREILPLFSFTVGRPPRCLLKREGDTKV